MKKISLFAIAALITTASFSQVKWGAQASGNLSTASLNADFSDVAEKTSVLGFGIGVTSEVSLSSKLSLRSSLQLLQKGGKLNVTFSEPGDPLFIETNASNKFYYAELPVNLVYNAELSSGKLFFGAGPSIGYGLFGKSKVTATNPFDPSEKETESYDAFKKEEDGGAGFKRFDFSANAIAGYQWKSGLFVNASYLLGLSNLIESEDGESYKNRGLQLTVGILF